MTLGTTESFLTRILSFDSSNSKNFFSFPLIYLFITTYLHVPTQWRIQEPPFWAVPIVATKKYTDVRLNGTPLSAYRTKKTAAMHMAHLRML